MLLTIGMLSYTAIPNVHERIDVSSQPVIEPVPLTLPSQTSLSISKNLTINPSDENELRLNITVASPTGEPASVRLQVFATSGTSCTYSMPTEFLLNQDTNNSSLSASIDSSNTYCFILDNQTGSVDKIVSIAASIQVRSQVVTRTNDGVFNLAGLGIGAVGFIIVFLGASRKAVIPWE